MPRLACLFVRDFPLAAHLRAEPELAGQPLAVVAGEGTRATLVAVSPEARARGVSPGVTMAQARSVLATLVTRLAAPAVLDAAAAALRDVAESFSPRVEELVPGEVLLDLEGLQSLFGTESHLGASLTARARRVGLDAQVAIASGKTAARLFARATEGVTVVAAGEERRRLAGLPLTLLEASPDLTERLARFGLHTLGDLGRLPASEVSLRLGPEGTALLRRARGQDDEPLRPCSRPIRFEESIDCGYAIERFEPLSFLIRAALERLAARLEVRSLRAGDLLLSLRIEDGGWEERPVTVAAPTLDVRVLLALLRTSFERQPPRGAVEGFRLAAVAERLRPIELDFFTPAGPSPDALDAAIARLVAIAGEGRVGRPAVVDSHRPEDLRVEPFALTAAKRDAAAAMAAGNPGEISTVALRALRPPLAVEVSCDRGRPDFLRGGSLEEPPYFRLAGRVVQLSGPWRLSGEWWREEGSAAGADRGPGPLERDYYDVELSDGGVYRMFCEHGRWFVAGSYD